MLRGNPVARQLLPLGVNTPSWEGRWGRVAETQVARKTFHQAQEAETSSKTHRVYPQDYESGKQFPGQGNLAGAACKLGRESVAIKSSILP